MPQNNAGLNAILPSRALSPLTLGVQSDLLVSHYHGQKYNQSYNGNLFSGGNPTAVTTSIGLATTCVGLIISNPAGNTKNLVLRRVSAVTPVAAGAVTGYGLITGFAAAGIVTHTTPLVPFSSKIGSTTVATTAKLDSAATLVGTPVWTMWFAAAIATASASFSTDIEGSIVLIPGAYAALGTSAASASSGFFGAFEWEEVVS